MKCVLILWLLRPLRRPLLHHAHLHLRLRLLSWRAPRRLILQRGPRHLFARGVRLPRVHVAEELYVIVSLSELALERLHLELELVDHLHLGVLVLDGLVADEGGLGRVGQRRQVLLHEGVARREAGDHQAVGVAPDRLLKQTRQLGVAVGDVLEGGELLGTRLGGVG